MTAINVIRTAEAVHVVSDGCGILDDGERIWTCTKVTAIPHLTAVIGLRGRHSLLRGMLGELIAGAFGSFDEMKRGILWLLEQNRPMIERASRGRFDLVVAGIGDNGPDSFQISNYDVHGDGTAWCVQDLGAICLQPFGEPVAGELLGRQLGWMTHPRGFDPDSDAIAIINAQRRIVAPLGLDGAAVQFCGGFVEVTTVSADGIHGRIVHRFAEAAPRLAAPLPRLGATSSFVQ